MAVIDRDALHHDPVLAETVRRLVDAFHPKTVYLFGSKARGDFDEDSDDDLLVVIPDESPPERGKSHRACTALRGTGAAADVTVWKDTDFQSKLHVAASLPATVSREGRLLYAA